MAGTCVILVIGCCLRVAGLLSGYAQPLANKMDSDALPLYPNVYPHSKIQVTPTEDVAMNQHRPLSPAPAPPVNQQAKLVLVGPENTVTTCPFCNASIKTSVRYTSNTRTHIAAALCSLICCCCYLPYCMDTAKNADHYCPNCQRYIGTYQR